MPHPAAAGRFPLVGAPDGGAVPGWLPSVPTPSRPLVGNQLPGSTSAAYPSGYGLEAAPVAGRTAAGSGQTRHGSGVGFSSGLEAAIGFRRVWPAVVSRYLLLPDRCVVWGGGQPDIRPGPVSSSITGVKYEQHYWYPTVLRARITICNSWHEQLRQSRYIVAIYSRYLCSARWRGRRENIQNFKLVLEY